MTTQQRYLPFGGERTNIGVITQTDLGYTGQRDLGMGLMDYKARFYSPYINHFLQPDTIIRNPAKPQTFNRFSYVINNPINRIDPSGHDDWWCGTASCSYNYYNKSNYSPEAELEYIKSETGKKYNTTLSNEGDRNWDIKSARVVDLALNTMNDAVGGNLNMIIGNPVLRLFNYKPTDECPKGCTYNGITHPNLVVNFYITSTLRLQNAFHEFGHVINYYLNNAITNEMSQTPGRIDGTYVFGGNGIGILPIDALVYSPKVADPYHEGGSEAIQHKSLDSDEQWADMWANYAIGNWNLITDKGALINDSVGNYLSPYMVNK
ncbi:MAG: RHS repeat-associated core domain-containing protein [Chloroflexi bacterium]|nr:RHS repeat-associated core domain-containing protein [Chloroflexota bacterium]